mmetsp:Transcript_29581/g.85613  ORF Transcript_29581/g.85613 Transcript_29581/m.85613 type:complete len:116 (-) Transcript_29581:1366-1713(-)
MAFTSSAARGGTIGAAAGAGAEAWLGEGIPWIAKGNEDPTPADAIDAPGEDGQAGSDIGGGGGGGIGPVSKDGGMRDGGPWEGRGEGGCMGMGCTGEDAPMAPMAGGAGGSGGDG